MKNLNFCENCNELTEQAVCPKCGHATREPQKNDICYIDEFGGMGRSMFADALSNNDIEFVAAPIHGGFSRMNTPSSYKLYVRYDQYDAAMQVLEAIFGGNDEQDNDDPSSVIDRAVKVIVDRPLGSVHPEHPDIKYELNYGYVDGVMGGDGEEQDAYIMSKVRLSLPRLKEFSGYVIAVIVRRDDVETKWVVAPLGEAFTKEEIAAAVHFQEKYFDIEIIM